MDEDSLPVTRVEVDGGRVEGDKTPVTAQRWRVATDASFVNCERAGAVYARSEGRSRRAIVDEDIVVTAWIPWDDVACARHEGDKAPVAADDWVKGLLVDLHPRAVDTYS
jgi:formylglycine-generating enzyme required for sulfatase activity